MAKTARKSIPQEGEEIPVGRLITCEAIKEFSLAGYAYLTLVSKKTGTRYTYKVKTPQGKPRPHFVSVLYGENNQEDYVFFGTIFNDKEFGHARKSAITPSDVRVRAWQWMWAQVLGGKLSPDVEVWHEGRCGRCGKLLTVPSSIARGIGPECAAKIGAL